ncbi:MAG: ATP-binding protein [Nocardioidaceae bacterium]
MWLLDRSREHIRVRVTLVAALAALVATSIGSFVFLLSLHRSLEAGLVSGAEVEITAITAQLADGASPQQVVITGGAGVVVQLVGAGGRVLATDDPATRARPLLSSPGSRTDMDVPGQKDEFTVVASRIQGNHRFDLIVVGRSTEQADQAQNVTSALLVSAIPLVVGLIALIVWLSVGRALRPVEAMRREAAAITSTHLGRRLALPPGGDEIPRLAITLNEMLDRIDQAHRLQRQFVSDASHELRSPLSAIRQTAEVARAYPDRVTKAQLAHDVLVESSRLEGLVNALLLLARLDDAAGSPGDDLVDLDDLVMSEVDRVRVGTPDVRLDVSHVSAGQVRGSAILLGQVVRNLVDNAVRHARSEVTLGLQERDGVVEMYVDDDGVGIPPDQRDRVFERFVRLDEARAREAGGTGLGLAIVRKIVEVSGGTVELGTAGLGGAHFLVVIPVAG